MSSTVPRPHSVRGLHLPPGRCGDSISPTMVATTPCGTPVVGPNGSARGRPNPMNVAGGGGSSGIVGVPTGLSADTNCNSPLPRQHGDDTLPHSLIASLNNHREAGLRKAPVAGAVVTSPKYPTGALGVTPSPAETPIHMDEFDRLLKAEPPGSGRRPAASTSAGTPRGTPRPKVDRAVSRIMSDEVQRRALFLQIAQLTAAAVNNSTAAAPPTAAAPMLGMTAPPTPASPSHRLTPALTPAMRSSPLVLPGTSLGADLQAPRNRATVGFTSPPPPSMLSDADPLLRIVQAAVRISASTTGGAVGGAPAPAVGSSVIPSASPQGVWPLQQPASAAERGTIDGEIMSTARRVHLDPGQPTPAHFTQVASTPSAKLRVCRPVVKPARGSDAASASGGSTRLDQKSLDRYERASSKRSIKSESSAFSEHTDTTRRSGATNPPK